MRWLAATLLLVAAASWGDVIVAASASRADVNTAVGSASAGDSVIIPAGTPTWTSAIAIPSGITIAGAGKTNTVITIGSTANAFSVAAGIDDFRISQIGFANTTDDDNWECVLIGTNKSTDGNESWLFDNNDITGCQFWFGVNGRQVNGVISNNTFVTSNSTGIRIHNGADDVTFTEDTELGTGKFLFVENNTFTTTESGSNHWVMCNAAGCRAVVRNNTSTESGASARWADPIDMHGFGHDTNGVGTRAFEIYGNTITGGPIVDTCCRPFFIRGGTGVIYDNTVDETNRSFNTGIHFTDYRTGRIAGTQSGPFSRTDSCTTAQYPDTDPGGEGYPACDQVGWGKNQTIDPVYVWDNVDHLAAALDIEVNNTDNGGLVATYIQENREYYASEKPGYIPYTDPHPLVGNFVETGGLEHADFEENDITDCDANTQEGSNTLGTSAGAAQRGTNLRGLWGVTATFDGTNDAVYCQESITTAAADRWARAYVFIPSGNTYPTATETPIIQMIDGGTNAVRCGVRRNAGGSGDPDQWSMNYNGTVTNSAATVVDGWNYIECGFISHASTGGGEMWINGVQTITDLDQDSTSLEIDTVRVGSELAVLANGDVIYFDDVIIDDARPGAYIEIPTSEAASVSGVNVTVTWVDAANVTHRIERKTGEAGGWAEIGTVAGGTQSYVDTPAGTSTYVYRIRADNGTIMGGYSGTAYATKTVAALYVRGVRP